MKRSLSASVDSSVIQPLGAGNDILAKLLLTLQHLIDPLLQRAKRDELMHLHVTGLAHPVGAVGRLILDGGIPPAVEVEHMVSRCKIEPDTACFDRENEYIRLLVSRQRLSIETAQSYGRARFWTCCHSSTAQALEAPAEAPAAALAHADILRENQAAFALLPQLLHHREQPLQLGRTVDQRFGVELRCHLLQKAQEWLLRQEHRMITELLQLRKRGENSAFAFNALQLLHAFHKLINGLIIECALLGGKMNIGLHLILIRQIELYRRILLLAAKHKRLNQLLQISRPLFIAFLLDGIANRSLKARGLPRKPGLMKS